MKTRSDEKKDVELDMLTRAAYCRAYGLLNAKDSELRLIGGELTAQEIRTVRAFVRYILGGNSK